ncbi:hypothetical protein BN874_690028 [Candidatus Contendobacter odensis Run_B_J11]|uniref:Uncharacterized protein n=2 Tax=Candidatus Contendibacter odensensis TaxID=1400860 RepID=A0A7U7GF13_9GAMM|nr:hypothetical protein BN874_690028 [Candidatus Contendobacter odensis Run_B_J11]
MKAHCSTSGGNGNAIRLPVEMLERVYTGITDFYPAIPDDSLMEYVALVDFMRMALDELIRVSAQGEDAP